MNRWSWQCLDCRSALRPEVGGLRCSGCRRLYPILSGVPILVGDPSLYVTSEIASLRRGAEDARQKASFLDRVAGDLGLTGAAIDRHRDVLDAEIAQIETLLGLIEPLAAPAEGKAGGRRSSGWGFDGLLHYLLRDWLGTPELDAQCAAIGAAVARVLPDPGEKTVIFAGCGAGGLVARLAGGFGRAIGFDLALPFLVAARRLLDGGTLDVAVSKTLHASGRVSLGGTKAAPVGLLAMDAFDTAFPDGVADCVVTAFFLDLLPDPRKLAAEIHRILAAGGVWINYGPSGPMKALWRFDGAEMQAFLETSGFAPIEIEALRATYLDLSREFPSWGYRSHVCTLTAARKAGPPASPPETPPSLVDLPDIIPENLPGAVLVRRHPLTGDRSAKIVLHHERIAGRSESFDVSEEMADLLALVDGKCSLQDIVSPLDRPEEAVQLFADGFRRGLLTWRRA